jgi:hypothetical protein
MSLVEELAEAGHTVLGPAKTVAEGLDIIEADKPELAILNINLEDGSKGTELAAVLVRRWNVPCLFVSGDMMEAREHQDLYLQAIRPEHRARFGRGRTEPPGGQEASSHSSRPGTVQLMIVLPISPWPGRPCRSGTEMTRSTRAGLYL